MLQRRPDFHASLLPLCASIARIRPRALIAERTDAIRREMEYEQKRGFLDD